MIILTSSLYICGLFCQHEMTNKQMIFTYREKEAEEEKEEKHEHIYIFMLRKQINNFFFFI